MDINSLIRTVEDFPKPGIGFKDITPLLSDPKGLRFVVDTFAERYRGKVDAVVGIESRGFIFGSPLAYALGSGLTVVRKPGKLPYETHRVTYDLEYGSDTLEVHSDALSEGARVVIVDDLLATGGTAKAAVELVAKLGAVVIECAFVLELGFLNGGDRLSPCAHYSIVKY